MKHKLLTFGLLSMSMIGLASCGNDEDNQSSQNQASSQTQESSEAAQSSEIAQSSEVAQSSQKASSSQNALSSALGPLASSEASSSVAFNKIKTTVYMVGDSTMCAYPNPDPYYYVKCGYGTQMSAYFDSNYVTFNNLALSGRSSFSFLKESNYTTLKNSIKEGDYLIIGWGHNDQKYGTATYRQAKYDTINDALADPDSFQSCIYNNYIKIAQDAGAYPIIATPIVRANSKDDYTGSSGHITNYGDYRQANIDIANKFNIPFVDLTTATKEEYTNIKYEEALKYHAVERGTDASEGKDPDWNSADTTHLNNYGASYVSYEFARLLKSSTSNLKYYVNDNIERPSEAILEKYSGYTWTQYSAPDLSNVTIVGNLGTTSKDASGNYLWYGTAFGDLGGDPTKAGNGYWAKETSEGVFKVGQGESTGSTAYKGKMADKSEGTAFVFKKLPIKTNFTLTVDAKILSFDEDGSISEAGLGLVLRDACWIHTNSKTILTNSVYAGLLTTSKTTAIANFSRIDNKITKSSNNITATFDTTFNATFTIKREGQTVYVTTKIGNTEYKNEYIDFSFTAKDSDYFYLGMFAARGIIAEFSNVSYTYDGEAMDA